jgi:radical SAM superfamily enzyme YgiQ (UPF0313 family)
MIDRIEQFDPDVIAITSLTQEGPEAHRIAAASKKRWPHRPVILGGPYTTSDYEKSTSDQNIDFCFLGEAEHSFAQWIEDMMAGSGPTAVPGIAYRENGVIKQNQRGDFVENLDDIPFPAWDIIDLDEYYKKRFLSTPTMSQVPMHRRVLPMVTSRGCPYLCTYCHNIFGKKIRKRSVENVIEELRLLREKYNIREIELIDDIFNLDIPRAKAIFQQVADSKLNMSFSFPNGLRSDSFDEELLDIMKRAGTYRLVFAIESGSKRIQKEVRKNLNLEKAQANIKLAHKKGFYLGGFFILGFPTETEEEVRETINFVTKSRLHTANIFILTPFPGTDLWQQALDAGLSVDSDFKNYYQVSLNLSNVPSERLDKLRRKALAKFYLNPIRLLRIAIKTPKFFQKSFEFAVILLLTLLGKWKN